MTVDGVHMESWSEWVASRRAGQLAFRGVDSVLRLVEKTLMWSTQTNSAGALPSTSSPGHLPECGSLVSSMNGNGAVPPSLMVVSRPLAWPLFIPVLGMLGVVRVTVYCVSRIIRRPCDTVDMIHWLQSRRRRMRAIKYAGLKNIRQQTEQKPNRTPNGTPCAKSVQSTTDEDRKRKYEDVEQSDWTDPSDDESVAVKLEKCDKDYDSETDPDFVPSSEDESSEDDGSAASDEEIEDMEESAVLVNGCEVQSSTPPRVSPSTSPSIVTVEPSESVSEYGSATADSTASIGSSVIPSLSPKSKFVKFFRRSSKTKQQL